MSAYDDAWLQQQLRANPQLRLVQGTLSSPLPVEAPEADLQGRLQALCKATGHLLYHPYRSTKSTPGWPDCAIVKEACSDPNGATLYLWELKRTGEQPSPAQRRWRDALARVTRVDVQVYWPADWPTIVAKLLRTQP